MAKGKKKSLIREYVEAFAVALIAALILRAFVIQAFRIPTGSMKDTLLIGDFLLVNKFVYGAKTPDRIPLINVKLPSFRLPALKEPERGDVVVFKFPLNEKLDYIKRCIGVPGDTIQINDEGVWINGRPEGKLERIGEEYDPEEYTRVYLDRVTTPNGKSYVIRHQVRPMMGQRIQNTWIVPPGNYFMMGDNRDNSQDSRYWKFMPHENIVGKALVIYWSWNKQEPIYKIWKKIRWERFFGVIR